MYLHFTPPQLGVVESIAFTCPLVGGEATYRARGLYAVVKDTMYDDQQLCAAAGIYYKKEASSVSQSSKGEQPKFTVYPNPAKDITTIECSQPLIDNCDLSVTDNKGSTVHNMPVNFTEKSVTISTEKLSSGLYFVRITSPTGILFVHKLNVVQ